MGGLAQHDGEKVKLVVMQTFYFWSAFSRAGTLRTFRLVASPQRCFDFSLLSIDFARDIINRTHFTLAF